VKRELLSLENAVNVLVRGIFVQGLGLLGFLLNLLQDLSLLSVMSIPTLKRLFASCKMISFLLDGQH